MDTAPDARLAFFEPEASPARTPTPRPRSASDPGPAVHHRLHGAVEVGLGAELRITTQAGTTHKSNNHPARIVIRRWFRKPDGNWWPVPGDSGVAITAGYASAFARAVAAAVEALAAEANPDHGRNGGDQ